MPSFKTTGACEVCDVSCLMQRTIPPLGTNLVASLIHTVRSAFPSCKRDIKSGIYDGAI